MRPTAIIGDIHGQSDRLDEMLADRAVADRDLVFLGDYVNRGPDSRGVVRRLMDLKLHHPHRVTFLRGNHDEALLAVLRGGPVLPLLQMGGSTTVMSWTPEVVGDVGAALRASVSPQEIHFLEGLEMSWSSDGFVAVHQIAEGAVESLALDVTLVVGHHIQRDAIPKVVGNVAFVDTGCGSMPAGRLSAMLLPERRFVSL
jgi:serine/threonine protein phosphatase 1